MVSAHSEPCVPLTTLHALVYSYTDEVATDSFSSSIHHYVSC